MFLRPKSYNLKIKSVRGLICTRYIYLYEYEKKYEWCHEDMFFLQLDSNVHILNEQIEWYNAGQCDMMYAKELIQHKQMSDYTEIMTRYTRYWEYFIWAKKITQLNQHYPNKLNSILSKLS